jgi:hypothetical protein
MGRGGGVYQHAGVTRGGGRELPLGESAKLSIVDMGQFYGIEILKWPALIAETALWLTDHQMNTELSVALGNYFQRIPLQAAPRIYCRNALRLDWNRLLPAKECSYVLGNPPFVGKQFQTAEQKEDMRGLAYRIRGSGVLDYVTSWYFKAVEYIDDLPIVCAFVSTNSITQGEQVTVFWGELLNRGVKIHFAHRTFAWEREAKGKAHVHVVIVGFGKREPASCALYEYEKTDGEPERKIVKQINPNLIDGPNVVIRSRSKPLCPVPPMNFGSMPNDGGHLILSESDRKSVLSREPELRPWIRPFVGSDEYINGIKRYCFWPVNAPQTVIRSSKILSERMAAVRKTRLASPGETTQNLAKTAAFFGEIRQPKSKYLVVP